MYKRIKKVLQKKVFIGILFLTAIAVLLVTGNQTGTLAQSASPASCKLYTISNVSGIDMKLFTLTLTPTPVYTPLSATYSAPDAFQALDIDPTSNIIYTASQTYNSQSGWIFRADANTGNLTPIGPTGYLEIESLSFKPNGTLYGWDINRGLVKINKSTGSSTLEFPWSSGGREFKGVTWDNTGNLLYMESEDGQLWVYNDINKTVTQVATNIPLESDSLEMQPNGRLLGIRDDPNGNLVVWTYDIPTKTVTTVAAFASSYNDARAVAWPASCGNITPGSPFPSPTVVPTATPSPTAVPTATPVPTPRCSSQCTRKEVGTTTSIGNNFSAQTSLIQSQDYWVRITINAATNPSAVRVRELINQSYFNIVDFASGNFKITSSNGGSETDVTNTICSDTSPNNGIPDCISNIQKNSSNAITGMDVQLDTLSGSNQRFIYFKVIPTNTTSSTKVNNSSSTTQYTTLSWTTPLNVGPDIRINAPLPYFQITSGSVFSQGNIDNKLPAGKTFITGTNSMVIHKGYANYGAGTRGTSSWDVSPYSITHDASIYNAYFNMYSTYISPIDITAMNKLTKSGYFVDNTAQSTGKLVIQGSGWDNQTLTGKNVVIFVNGDLYIKSNFLVAKDGKTNLIFIVKGRVGIDPTVTNIEGIYLSDGIIDTSCSTTSGFQTDNTCTPNASSTSGGSTLTLNGVYYSNSGFALDRDGNIGVTPGEVFTTRPDLFLSATAALGKNTYSWTESNQ